jgi:hypothetical protein
MRSKTVLMLSVALCALAAAQGASATPKAQEVAYYMKHPCSLVTAAEVQKLLGPQQAAAPLVSANGSTCGSRTTSTRAADQHKTFTLQLYLGPEPLASARSIGKVVSERKLSKSAYCIEVPGYSGTLYASTGILHDYDTYLSIAVDNCSHAAALYKLAATRLA